MLNFTLTIAAAPELLAAISTFSNAINCAKVVAVPQNNYESTAVNPSKEHKAAEVSYNQPALQAAAYQWQNPSVQQTIQTQQVVQTQVPANGTPIYNQPNTVPVNSGSNPIASAPAYMVQAQQQANIQTAPAQTPTVPTSAQTYSMEQLAVAATQIVDAGRRTELVSLLNSFGVQALTALPKEHYGAFATQLRALGAKL